jgi:hypothetical protein
MPMPVKYYRQRVYVQILASKRLTVATLPFFPINGDFSPVSIIAVGERFFAIGMLLAGKELGALGA